MVDEFSSFARMPQPVFKHIDLSELCRQTVELESSRYPAIDYQLDLTDRPVFVECDGQQVDRALTNILKNAAEAIIEEEAGEMSGDRIRITLREETDRITLSVEDNGRGLPETMLDRLTEPYVTTRAKGTGLGLAIAKKIMEDHSGRLHLQNAEPHGARASLVFLLDVQDHPAAEQESGAHGPAEKLKESLPHGA